MKRCLNCFGEYADVFTVCPFCGYSEGCQSAEGKALKPGTVLRQRYLIGKAAGSGGFGIAYRAFDRSLGRRVAVKEFFPHRAAGRGPDGREAIAKEPAAAVFERGKKKFLAEARLLSDLRESDQIPRVTDFFEENNTVYIVMELLEGRALSHCAGGEGSSRTSLDFALYTVCECALAAAVLHRKGYVHGDIAPDNIFVCSDGNATRVKLIDFGAARRVGTEVPESDLMYKPGFSAPECCRAGKAMKSSDVYSLGATLYMLLTGRKPAPAGSGGDAAQRSDFSPKIPSAVADLVIRSTSPEPEKRPADADAFLRELRRAAGKKLLPGKPEKNIAHRFASRDEIREDPMQLYDLAIRGDAVGTTHPIPERLLPGTTLDKRYSVGLDFRRAGVCAAYSGTDLLLDSDVRIYEYFPEGLCRRDEDGVRVSVTDTIGRFDDGLSQFVSEASRLCEKSGTSPGVEFFSAIFREAGTAYLIAEDRGEIPLLDFEKYLARSRRGRRSRLPAEDVFRVLGPAAAVIDSAADEGGAYGAISPDSILVGTDGRGVMRFRGGLFYPGLIFEGKRRGFYSRGYTAPELSDGRPDTPESDVYSFAAVACRLLTGHRPPDAAERTAALACGWIDPLEKCLSVKGISSDLAARLKKAMSILPGERGRASDVLAGFGK